MVTDQRTPPRRRHWQHEKESLFAGWADPIVTRGGPWAKVIFGLSAATIEPAALSATTRTRPRKTELIFDGQGPANAGLRLAVDHAAPSAKITITEREGNVTLTGTTATPAERIRAGFSCWAFPTTCAVYNDITLTS